MISEVLKKEDLLKKHMKKLMPFVQYVKVCSFTWLYHNFSLSLACPSVCLLSTPQQSLSVKGTEALDLTLPFDEKLTLLGNINYLTRSLDVRMSESVPVPLYFNSKLVSLSALILALLLVIMLVYRALDFSVQNCS